MKHAAGWLGDEHAKLSTQKNHRGHRVEPEHPRGMCQLATGSALALAALARGAAVMSGVAAVA